MPLRRVGLTAGIPVHEARRLMALVTGTGLAHVKTGVDLTAEERQQFQILVRRRLAGEPLQYLEGSVRFGPVELKVDQRVLIPRPETEYMFEMVTASRPDARVIVDLCTGSGALALALKHHYPAARVLGVDLSEEALEVARNNGRSSGLSIEWLGGDLYEALPADLGGAVDLLVANPPYIAEPEWDDLPADVRHEPRIALVAGPTGTEVAEKLFASLAAWLSPAGEAWVEVGEAQAEGLARRWGGRELPDQYGRARYVRVR